MSRLLALIYGAASYLFALCALLYAIGFLGDFAVPKTVDAGGAAPWPAALPVDLALLALFAIQHSVMARRGFKRWWTLIVPECVERSTYVLLSGAILAVLYVAWRPMPDLVWSVDAPLLRWGLQALSAIGWGVLLLSTFLINHFELFGLQQVFDAALGRETAESGFRTPSLYRVVRHPLYLGLVIVFWAVPDMTIGHLLFSAGGTGYILLGIAFEERDLVHRFGDAYRQYRREVRMLLPWPRRG